jgi:hypothetical protein
MFVAMKYVSQTAPSRNASEDPNLRLTAGGAIVYRRTRRPAETCNAVASMAGIYAGEDRAR